RSRFRPRPGSHPRKVAESSSDITSGGTHACAMTTTLTVLAVLVLTAAPATAGSSGDVGMHDVVARAGALSVVEQQRVLDYWTPRRMAAAVPAGLLGPSGRLARWLGA